MGIYTKTNFNIECDNLKTAKKVYKTLFQKIKETNNEGECFSIDNLEMNGSNKEKNEWGEVEGFMDSGRIQNLAYQTNLVWDVIKDIEGVKEMNCPFMSESDGEYYS